MNEKSLGERLERLDMLERCAADLAALTHRIEVKYGRDTEVASWWSDAHLLCQVAYVEVATGRLEYQESLLRTAARMVISLGGIEGEHADREWPLLVPHVAAWVRKGLRADERLTPTTVERETRVIDLATARAWRTSGTSRQAESVSP